MSSKLYIEVRPAPQLYLATRESPELILKSVESSELFLKAKYTKRTGSPGSYKYTYAEGSGGGKSKKIKLSKTGEKLLSQPHGTHTGGMNLTQLRTLDKLEASGHLEMRGSNAYATEKGKAALSAHRAESAEKKRATQHGSVDKPTTASGRSSASTASGTDIASHRESHRENMSQGMSQDQHEVAEREFTELAKDPKLNAEQKAAAAGAGQVHASEAGRMRYEARYSKSQDPLYLDLNKANSFRDPSQGKYIAGGAIKAKTEDLSETLSNLMNQLPGEELDKK